MSGTKKYLEMDHGRPNGSMSGSRGVVESSSPQVVVYSVIKSLVVLTVLAQNSIRRRTRLRAQLADLLEGNADTVWIPAPGKRGRDNEMEAQDWIEETLPEA